MQGNDKTSRIAAQLYTVREQTQTADDLAKTLARVRAMGYQAVQISAIGRIDTGVVARLLADEGLVCCATHTSIQRLRDEPDAVIDELRRWGCGFTAIGGHFPERPTADEWHRFAGEFNGIFAKFKEAGIALGYHNHSHELIRFGDRTALQILYEQFDPEIAFEIDTYWIIHGGGDPAAWIRKMVRRIPCIHLKDMGINLNREQIMMEVGEGNLNWPEVLQACHAAHVEWYIVEQDTCYRDPFESLRISLRNLTAMFGTQR